MDEERSCFGHQDDISVAHYCGANCSGEKMAECYAVTMEVLNGWLRGGS